MKSDIKYVLLLFTFLSLTNVNSLAQPDSTIAKNTIFIEGLGNGIIGSVNYDRLLLIKKLKFSYRLGFIYLPLKNKSFYSIPIEFNFLKGKKNHIEFGIGFSYVDGLNSRYYHVPDGSNFSTIYEYSKAIYLNVKLIGYRFQKEKGGLFVKVSGLILFKALEINDNYTKRANEFTLGPYIGVSIGYTIKKKTP